MSLGDTGTPASFVAAQLDESVAVPARGVEYESEQHGVTSAHPMTGERLRLRGAETRNVRIQRSPAALLSPRRSSDGDDFRVEVDAGHATRADLASKYGSCLVVGFPDRMAVENGAESDRWDMAGDVECALNGAMTGDVVQVAGQTVGSHGEEYVRAQRRDRLGYTVAGAEADLVTWGSRCHPVTSGLPYHFDHVSRVHSSPHLFGSSCQPRWCSSCVTLAAVRH